MSSSSNTDHLKNLVQPRNQSLCLILSAKQAISVHSNLKSIIRNNSIHKSTSIRKLLFFGY